MKITAINSNQTRTVQAHNTFKAAVNTGKQAQMKQFMSELDIWTKESLERIDKKYASGTKLKEDAIESLFAIRDIKIEAKKQELFPKDSRPLWRKALVALGILSY